MNRSFVNRALDVGLWVALVIAAMMALSCAVKPHLSTVPDSLPAVGSGVERTSAHVESAERLNNAAKPIAGSAAAPLLNQVTEEHGAALSSLSETRRDLKSANDQRARLTGDNVKLAGQLTQVTSGWGYRLQLWVARVFWILVASQVASYLLGAIALATPAGGAGAILARIGVYLNPFAWFQSARDNYYFRVKSKSAPAT